MGLKVCGLETVTLSPFPDLENEDTKPVGLLEGLSKKTYLKTSNVLTTTQTTIIIKNSNQMHVTLPPIKTCFKMW